MYHFIVSKVLRSTWKKIDAGDIDAPWRMAAPDFRFTFVGDTPFGRDGVDRDEFRTWFHDFVGRFETISFEVCDVAIAGWPWRTSAAARLRVTAVLPDGTRYENDASQWIRLRWGKMTDDWVIEDTKRLEQAFGSASSHPTSGTVHPTPRT